MKALKVIIGLIYDDPWLVGGIVISLILAKILSAAAGGQAVIGIVFAILLMGSIIVSVLREVRKKRAASAR